MKKIETVAEFLARGGTITKVPTQPVSVKSRGAQFASSNGPAVILTMDEASLYHGEYKPKKVKKKNKSVIDISALPEALRKKYIDGVINGSKEENYSDQDSNDYSEDGDDSDSDGDAEE